MDRSKAGKLGYLKSREKLERLHEARTQHAVDTYLADPKYCPRCGIMLPFEKRWNTFCGRSCSASTSNKGRPGPTKRPRECAHCGARKEDVRNKYCDTCIKNNIHVEVRKATSLAGTKVDRLRKRILIEERGHTCEVCGNSGWMGQPIPLELDHIDGDSDNNASENLRLICPNCHALTPTYKGANMGGKSKRQINRRARYKEGKTF